jgi:hypothetical protein
MDAAKNFAKATVDGLYDDEATSIDVASGGGARFPAVPFNAVWWNATDFPDPSDDPNVEVIRVTGISTDTLTIARGHEGTGSPGVAGFTHEIEGKTYKLVAGLTAKAINDDMLPTTRTGDDFNVPAPGALEFEATDQVALRSVSSTVRVESQAGGMVMEVGVGGTAGLGDADENDSGAALLVSNSLAQVSARGHFGTDQTASATVAVGTLAAKMPIYNLAGTLIGYIPIYGSIT